MIELFKAGGFSVVKALTLLFNIVLKSLDTLDIVVVWRQGYVVSIFKSGHRYDVGVLRCSMLLARMFKKLRAFV